MKNILLLASLVFSAVSAASTFAQDAFYFPTDALIDLEPKAARVGMSRDEVIAQLGKPSETMGDHLWAYWNFRAAGQPEGAPGNTLVVVFTKDKVSLLRITERRLVEAAMAKARVDAKAATVARK